VEEREAKQSITVQPGEAVVGAFWGNLPPSSCWVRVSHPFKRLPLWLLPLDSSDSV
jgi:hypothetical protein